MHGFFDEQGVEGGEGGFERLRGPEGEGALDFLLFGALLFGEKVASFFQACVDDREKFVATAFAINWLERVLSFHFGWVRKKARRPCCLVATELR